MTHELYAVKDNLAGVFMMPQPFQNGSVATRNFSLLINETAVFKENPADFELWRLGSFDDQEGTLIPDLQKIVTGTSVKKGE